MRKCIELTKNSLISLETIMFYTIIQLKISLNKQLLLILWLQGELEHLETVHIILLWDPINFQLLHKIQKIIKIVKLRSLLLPQKLHLHKQLHTLHLFTYMKIKPTSIGLINSLSKLLIVKEWYLSWEQMMKNISKSF